MSTDPIELAKTLGAPLLGVVGGWITSALKATSRVTALETEVGSLRKYVTEEIGRVAAGWRLEFEHQKQDQAEKVKELKEAVKAIQESFDRFTRASHHDFADNDAFIRYVEEMNRQWKTVERTLGQIEGWMKAQKHPPSSFPSPTLPTTTRTR